jgi:hypothetical protein
MLPLTAIADDWHGAAVMMGNLGDDLWRYDRQDVGRALSRPREYEPAAAGLREFRLHAGIVLVHVPTIGAIHSARIHEISRSPELAPWVLGNEYDRPLPRRIVEDAGVPRTAFGQAVWNTIDAQTPELARRLRSTSYASFVDGAAARLRGPNRWRLLAEWHGGDAAVEATVREAAKWWGRAHRVGAQPIADGLRASVSALTRWQWHRSLPVQYTFHWANGELAARSREALDAARATSSAHTGRTADARARD